MSKNKLWLLIAIVAIGLIGFVSHDAFAHSGGDVTIRDGAGAVVTGGTPYSPKATCARACHVSELPAAMQTKYPAGFDGHKYGQHDEALASKNHTQKNAGAMGAGTEYNYSVPFPKSGVSASYHVQQGRGVEWGQTQRDAFQFYANYIFPSSNSMYGKA